MPKGCPLGQWTHVPCLAKNVIACSTPVNEGTEITRCENIYVRIKKEKKSCISKKASHDKRNKFIYLTNVFNYVLSVVTMFSLSFIDRLFCCCFCPVIGIFQMTFQNTFTSHIISKHSVFLLFVYAICIWSVPSSYYLCGPHLVCARCKMMQTAKQWVRPS